MRILYTESSKYIYFQSLLNKKHDNYTHVYLVIIQVILSEELFHNKGNTLNTSNSVTWNQKVIHDKKYLG